MSVESSILDGVVSMMQALELPPPVVKRKAPKREALVDAATQITVSTGGDPEQLSQLALGGVLKVRYPVDVSIIAPNPDDYLTNLDTYTDWRESIRNKFRPPWTDPIVPGVAQVFDIDIDPGVFLDRDKIKDFYDYFTVRAWIITAE